MKTVDNKFSYADRIEMREGREGVFVRVEGDTLKVFDTIKVVAMDVGLLMGVNEFTRCVTVDLAKANKRVSLYDAIEAAELLGLSLLLK